MAQKAPPGIEPGVANGARQGATDQAIYLKSR